MSSFPDAVVFRNPDNGQYADGDCVKEDDLLSKCMQVRACDVMVRSFCFSCVRGVAAECCRLCLIFVACSIPLVYAKYTVWKESHHVNDCMLYCSHYVLLCLVSLGCTSFQTNLNNYGFSSDEIATILGKRHPTPKPPSVEVAKKARNKAAGQRGGKPTEKDERAEGKEGGGGESTPNRDSKAPEGGERPNVEVEERPKNGERR